MDYKGSLLPIIFLSSASLKGKAVIQIIKLKRYHTAVVCCCSISPKTVGCPDFDIFYIQRARFSPISEALELPDFCRRFWDVSCQQSLFGLMGSFWKARGCPRIHSTMRFKLIISSIVPNYMMEIYCIPLSWFLAVFQFKWRMLNLIIIKIRYKI